MTHSSNAPQDRTLTRGPARPAKCVVWDLDNTLWAGTLLEGDDVCVRPEALATIEALDARGILNSIASRNDHAHAYEVLKGLGLARYFVSPQIAFGPKSVALRRIADELNIGIDSLVFVDDDPFEREEVAAAAPQVRCFDAAAVGKLLDLLDLRELQITEESRGRRALYQAENRRQQAEQSFVGTNEDFLRSLGMVMTIGPAMRDDLERAHELTARTSQLNSCGRVYSIAELEEFRVSPTHRLLVVGLEDKYGVYGRVGLALIELGAELWTLKLLLTSCRVMSRGIGTSILSYILNEARRAGVRFAAEFIPTERNRVMLVMYRFAGLVRAPDLCGVMLMEHDLKDVPRVPDYIKVAAVGSADS